MASQPLQEDFEEQDDPIIEQDVQTEGNDGDPEPSEEQARRLGWRPKDEYVEAGRNPDHWQDWKDFLDDEKQNTPVLRAANKLLKRKLASVDKKMRKMESTFAEAREYFTQAEERAYNRAVADIRKRQRDAVSLGDTEAFDEADQELADLSKEVQQKAPKQPEIDPDVTKVFKKWERDNDWYGSDDVMTAVADRIAQKMGTYVDNDMDPEEYLEELTVRVKKELPHKFKSDPPPKKRSAVEGVSEARVARGAETFENLPLEARQQYQRFVDMDVPVKKESFTKNAWEKINKERKK